MSSDLSGKRRAAIEAQFTWLFALLAGAVIFLFFVMFIRNWGESSEQTFCADVREHLTTVFTGAQASPGTMNNISIPKLDIQFDCTGYNLPCRESLGSNIIFSPERLRGHALITYALGWDMPYRSANMLYLTQPEARYIFLKEVEEVYDLMPDAVNTELVSETEASSLKTQNSPHVRVVVRHDSSELNVNLGTLNSLDAGVLSVIGIEHLGTELNKVTYFEQDSKGSQKFNPIATFEVIGEEALLGAVFSGSSELFGCTLGRALERYQYVTEVYLNRATELKSATLPKACTDRYATATALLTDLYGEIITYSNDLGSPGDIQKYVEDLSALNGQLKLFSCPTLY